MIYITHPRVINWSRVAKSVIRTGTCAIVSTLFLLLFPTEIQAAQFSLQPSNGARTIAQSFAVTVRVQSPEKAANAFEGVINYPPNLLAITTVSTGGSVCTLWTKQPSYNNNQGSASFSCGLPTPGFTGSSTTVMQITFRAKATGTANVSISNAKILANDGVGTNIHSGNTNAVFTINQAAADAPSIQSGSHPDQNKWYQSREVTFTWNKTSGVDGFSLAFNQDQDFVPGTSVSTTDTAYMISEVADGVWYFHLRSNSTGGWSSPSRFRVQIDNTGPKNVELVIDPAGTTERRPMLSFSAIDDLSGIDRYELSWDDGEFEQITSPHIPETLTAGTHQLTFRAIDLAGNYSEVTESIVVVSPGQVSFISPTANQAFNVGDEIHFYGTAKPLSEVLIYIDGTPIKEVVVVGEDGRFSYVFRDLLKPGPHEIYAEVRYDGIVGEKTDSIRIVIDGTLVDLFGIKLSLWTLLSVLLWIIIILIIIIFILYRRRKKDKPPRDDEVVSTVLVFRDQVFRSENDL